MAGTTTFYKLPYPTGTDRVADGDNAMQALAEKVESVTGQWVAYTPGGMQNVAFQPGAFFRWRKDGTTIQVVGYGGLLSTAAGAFAITVPPGHNCYMGGLGGYRAVGHWMATHASVNYGGTTAIMNQTDMMFVVNGVNWVSNASPVTWSVGDPFSFALSYETTVVPT